MSDSKPELSTYDLTESIWRKAAASGAENNCVEMAELPGGAVVRDSKDLALEPLRFTASQWAAFREGVASGEL